MTTKQHEIKSLTVKQMKERVHHLNQCFIRKWEAKYPDIYQIANLLREGR